MADATVVENDVVEVAQRTPKQIAWGRFTRNKVGVYAGIASIFFVTVGFFAPIITRLVGVNAKDTYDGVLDEFAMPIGKWGGMSLAHPLGIEPGTGRDVFALALYGARTSFIVAIIATVGTISIGMLVGIATGYFKGITDSSVGRFADFLLAFPATFMIIALSLPMVGRVESTGFAHENSARLVVLVLFLVFFGWTGFYRLIRSQAMSMRERDFVMAAQAMGASNWRIIVKELLPNLWPTAIVFISLTLPGYIAAEATFSFLGVGVQAPEATFGLILSDAVSYWKNDPAYLLIPCLILIAIVLSLNLLGDAVRDALDPKANR
ncbi:DppC ABC-type dipeptide/oligopeptide/nickel transport systems, permease components [Candidatus Nanopelagicaceae bacterium]